MSTSWSSNCKWSNNLSSKNNCVCLLLSRTDLLDWKKGLSAIDNGTIHVQQRRPDSSGAHDTPRKLCITHKEAPLRGRRTV